MLFVFVKNYFNVCIILYAYCLRTKWRECLRAVLVSIPVRKGHDPLTFILKSTDRRRRKGTCCIKVEEKSTPPSGKETGEIAFENIRRWDGRYGVSQLFIG